MNADDRVIVAVPQRTWRKSPLINAGRIWETLINMLPTVLKCEREDQNPRAVRCMKVCSAIWLIALALVSGGAGYLLRAQKTDGSLVLSVKDAVQEEYLSAPDSYSRVENTKNALDALCAQLRIGIQDAALKYDLLASNGQSSSQEAAMVLEHGIDVAEAAVREFEGTEQQLYVMQDLLQLLDRGGRFELWTEFYLKALHEHPTHSVVCRFAHEAVRISKLAGQQKQVLEGLRYAVASPAEFAGRGEIQAALHSVQSSFAQAEVPRNGGVHLFGSFEVMK
jgi:hypothetical protein